MPSSDRPQDPALGRITREFSRHFEYSADAPPATEVAPGTRLVVETLDTRSGALLDRTRGAPYELPRPTPGRGNPVTGPIAVQGATAGHSVVVHIHDVTVERIGWCGGHAHVGPTRPGFVPRPIGRTCQIDDGIIQFGSGIGIPIEPMIGCIGTAPASPVSTALAGRHGGNMDQPVVRAGATVHLPVFHEGGRLFLGDLHAAQGDGELSGVALEIPGEVEITIDLRADLTLSWPWLVNDQHIAVLTAANSFEEARAEAVENMVRSITARHGLEEADAVALISLTGDLRIGQSFGGEQLTLRLEMPHHLELSPVA